MYKVPCTVQGDLWLNTSDDKAQQETQERRMPHLVEPLVPQEAPRKEGPARNRTEQRCLKVRNCLVRHGDERAAIEVANTTQHVAQGCFGYCLCSCGRTAPIRPKGMKTLLLNQVL